MPRIGYKHICIYEKTLLHTTTGSLRLNCMPRPHTGVSYHAMPSPSSQQVGQCLQPGRLTHRCCTPRGLLCSWKLTNLRPNSNALSGVVTGLAAKSLLLGIVKTYNYKIIIIMSPNHYFQNTEGLTITVNNIITTATVIKY